MNKFEKLKSEIETKEKELLKLKEELQNIKIYETFAILTLKTNIQEFNDIKLKIEDIVGKNNIEKFEELGKKTLAYEIKGNKEGYYIDFIWYGEKENCTELEKYFRQENNILKYITMRINEEDL